MFFPGRQGRRLVRARCGGGRYPFTRLGIVTAVNYSLSCEFQRALPPPMGEVGRRTAARRGRRSAETPFQSRLAACQLSQRESQGRSRASAINYNLPQYRHRAWYSAQGIIPHRSRIIIHPRFHLCKKLSSGSPSDRIIFRAVVGFWYQFWKGCGTNDGFH